MTTKIDFTFSIFTSSIPLTLFLFQFLTVAYHLTDACNGVSNSSSKRWKIVFP